MPRFFVPALLMLGALSASGAELGEVSVRSHIGQQLSADIELVDLSAADLADLQVRLASADVFAGARVSMNPALAGLNLSVYKNGARRVLHLTTLQPVNAELVHIFFELGSGGRQFVRTASLWLTPEPPGAAQALASASVPAATPVTAATASQVATRGATVAAPAASASPAAPTPAIAAAGAPAVPSATRAVPARPLVRPSPAHVAHNSPDEEMMKSAAKRAFAARAPRPVAQAARLALAPVPVHAVEACSPALVEARTQQCAAMDASNKELTTKLVDLEGKVKRLQTTLAAAPAGAATAAAPAPAAHAGAALAPTPKVSAAEATPAKSAAAEREASAAASVAASAAHSASGAIKDARAAAPEAGKAASAPARPAAAERAAAAPEEEKTKKMSRPRLITLIAGGAVGLLALIGVTVHLLRKRRAKGGPLKIWQSFRKKDKPESPVEPSMNEATESAAAVAVQE